MARIGPLGATNSAGCSRPDREGRSFYCATTVARMMSRQFLSSASRRSRVSHMRVERRKTRGGFFLIWLALLGKPRLLADLKGSGGLFAFVAKRKTRYQKVIRA